MKTSNGGLLVNIGEKLKDEPALWKSARLND